GHPGWGGGREAVLGPPPGGGKPLSRGESSPAHALGPATALADLRDRMQAQEETRETRLPRHPGRGRRQASPHLPQPDTDGARDEDLRSLFVEQDVALHAALERLQ